MNQSFAELIFVQGYNEHKDTFICMLYIHPGTAKTNVAMDYSKQFYFNTGSKRYYIWLLDPKTYRYPHHN